MEPGEILSRHPHFNNEVMKRLLEWSHKMMWSNKTGKDYATHCKNFYITKSLERIEKYLNDRRLDDVTSTINGVKVPPTAQLINQATQVLLSDIKPTFFHGDFILENILLTPDDKFALIDWRQDFAGCLDYGDAYYDISKMNHNLIINHDIINEGHYQIKFDDNNNVFVDVLCSKKFIDASSELRIFCNKHGFDLAKVDILTPIIWINMAPLHDKKFGDFLFNFGRLNLYNAIKCHTQ
jgi:thiamine kinase-like enzyme